MNEQIAETEVSEPDEVTEVDAEELSDDDLAKALGEDESEAEETPAEAKDSEEEEKQEETKPEQAQAQNPEDAKRIAELEAANAKMTSQLAQQEQFIQRRNGELGTTRAKLVEAISILKGKLDEKYLESPSEGIKLQKDIEKLEGKVEQIDEEAEGMNQTFATQKAVAKFIQPNEVSMDAMVACLQEDGLDPHYIEQFKSNPFQMGAAATIHLAKRAKAIRDRDEARHLALQFYERLQKLEKEPQSLAKQIKTVAKQRPGVNGGSGKSPGKKATPTNPALMTDEEIKQLLEAAEE